MNHYLRVVLVWLFVLMPIITPTASAQGTAEFILSTSTTAVETGETFAVQVSIQPNQEVLDTARLELGWNAGLLEALSVELGTAFPYPSPANTIENGNGRLSHGAFTYSDLQNNTGLFATITFRALTSGTATISVQDSSKLISNGEEQLNASVLDSVSVSVSGEPVDPLTEFEEVEEVASNPELEQQALVYFGAFYARMPSNGNDWQALHCIAYGGCQGNPRNLQAEENALILFGVKYAKMPATSMEWNVLHTIAYTNLLTWDQL